MPVSTNLRRLLVVSLLAAACCLTGCNDDDDGIRAYDAPKDPPVVQHARALSWELPPAWQEVPDASGAQFGRFATIQVSEKDPLLLLTVNRTSSGDLASNLNRWERILGLPETPEAAVAAKVKPVEMDGHVGQRVDLTGNTSDED